MSNLCRYELGVFDFLSMALKGAKLKGEVWSFDCYTYSVKAKIGDLELNFEIPYGDIEPSDYDDDDTLSDVLYRDGIEIILR